MRETTRKAWSSREDLISFHLKERGVNTRNLIVSTQYRDYFIIPCERRTELPYSINHAVNYCGSIVKMLLSMQRFRPLLGLLSMEPWATAKKKTFS